VLAVGADSSATAKAGGSLAEDSRMAVAGKAGAYMSCLLRS
jgi:hypothetical protein